MFEKCLRHQQSGTWNISGSSLLHPTNRKHRTFKLSLRTSTICEKLVSSRQNLYMPAGCWRRCRRRRAANYNIHFANHHHRNAERKRASSSSSFLTRRYTDVMISGIQWRQRTLFVLANCDKPSDGYGRMEWNATGSMERWKIASCFAGEKFSF